MPLRTWFARSTVQPGAPGLFSLSVAREDWRTVLQDLAATGSRLLALWSSSDETTMPVIRAAFLTEQSGLILNLRLTGMDQPYPGLENLFPCASRMQRAIADLAGVRSSDPDQRSWLRHTDRYDFVRVEGEGVHEIPVGPVHAGTIEPGHFRFSVVGEKVLRLEERLGYVHKGIEQRFTELPIMEGQRLAARVSGDSAVAFSWAYCQALEGMSGASIPARGAWLRAAYLELERIANHLGDLGALGNDAGFAFGLAQFSRLKEQLLRTVRAVFGARYLMDAIAPGGVRADLTRLGADQLTVCVNDLALEVSKLRTIYDEHEGVRDRFTAAGVVTTELATRLGLTGLAGRASGQLFDLRVDLPCRPYSELGVRKCGSREGDVAARVAVRFDELLESCRLIHRILDTLPSGPCLEPLAEPADGSHGTGLVEGWRGPVFVSLEAGPAGSIRRCHPHDPSWQNWPVLEHAIIGNIVPDFPLINKSFNLSYSGHDL
jgi:Ni,Fe-hydrogenase III large subunit